MVIELKKFGTTLLSRQAGREALAAFQPTLREVGPTEKVTVEFTGILTFSPSWGDEFLTPLAKTLGDRLTLAASDNPSVKATLEILAASAGRKFKVGGG